VTAYTPSQLRAIECVDDPLQIVACAGSGKTQVVSARIARILKLGLAEPSQIVAFTFTDKAAAELKDRVLREVEIATGQTTGMAEMFIGTMHAFALNLLQTYVPESFKYSVLAEMQTRLLVDRNSLQSGLTTCPTMSPNTPFLKRYTHSRLYLQVLGVLREDEVDNELVPLGVLESGQKFRTLLHNHRYFDYTEMLQAAAAFLELPDETPASLMLHRHIRDLKFIVVDEYQDVNPIQEKLVQGLCQYGANLCVVGDDDQTIYQWRGSEVRNILKFADRHEDVEVVTLADNFRSSVAIVEVGRNAAEQIPSQDRLPKTMLASGHQVFERGDLLALDFDSPEAEAAWICDRVESMRGLPFRDDPDSEPRGLAWSDFSVLFRSVAKDADELVAEMRRRQIPHVVRGLNRLFDSIEIQAVVAVFDYMVGQITGPQLQQKWQDAGLIPAGADFGKATAVLDLARQWETTSRSGVVAIQRVYQDFLAAIALREETVPGPLGRAELVFYQLGKFSQAISDFEQIYFSSTPYDKYTSFVKWLEHHAPDYYADSDDDVGYARPDAVSISTVHQAKGMQWPAVFVPCLRKNRFPSQRHGGLRLDHVIPAMAIPDFDRYLGQEQDERRLFYVAVTRSQKWLFVTHSPGRSSRYRARSPYFDEVTRSTYVLTREPGVTDPSAGRLQPQPKTDTPQVTLSFTELKYLFECPYQFKLRFLYGFNPPIHEAMGFGKGLHDALSEVHKRALEGDLLGPDVAADLVDRHLWTPFAYPALKEQLRASAIDAVERYLIANAGTLQRTLHSEKQIQVHVGPGVVVDGRIDLIRRLDTDETSIVDFKSSDRAQTDEVTRDQLHVYALGYLELTGANADLIEVVNLDPDEKSSREVIELPMLDQVRDRIQAAGDSLRANDLPRLKSWCQSCESCDVADLCRTRPGTK
jgi:DNA helicase-2/ATP-dependent DNA helicase PcrA